MGLLGNYFYFVLFPMKGQYININDLFLFCERNITNYADDTTPYAFNNDVNLMIEQLENDLGILSEWFKNNYMKLNSDKCKLLTNNEKDSVSIKIGNDITSNTTQVKLLGITLDKSFTFNKHVTILCKKANQKLHALARISKYMSTQQLRLIMKAFISSQFGYCPLIWMFHNRKLNSRINRIQERSLRFVYNYHKSTFSELLKKDNSVTVHNKNIQVLATEIYKIKQGMHQKGYHQKLISRTKSRL